VQAALSEDKRPEEERGQDELIAAFAALGGPLTTDELIRLLGSEEYYRALVRLAALLLDGDTALAEAAARDSLASVQRGWSRLGDPGKARIYLQRTVVNRARSIRRHRAIGDRGTPQAAPPAPAAGHTSNGGMDLEPWVSALRTLGDSELEVVVLHKLPGSSGRAGRRGDEHQHRGSQEPSGARHVITPAPAGMIPADPPGLLEQTRGPERQPAPGPAWPGLLPGSDQGRHPTTKWLKSAGSQAPETVKNLAVETEPPRSAACQWLISDDTGQETERSDRAEGAYEIEVVTNEEPHSWRARICPIWESWEGLKRFATTRPPRNPAGWLADQTRGHRDSATAGLTAAALPVSDPLVAARSHYERGRRHTPAQHWAPSQSAWPTTLPALSRACQRFIPRSSWAWQTCAPVRRLSESQASSSPPW